jgi:hypothetical protein
VAVPYVDLGAWLGEHRGEMADNCLIGGPPFWRSLDVNSQTVVMNINDRISSGAWADYDGEKDVGTVLPERKGFGWL